MLSEILFPSRNNSIHEEKKSNSFVFLPAFCFISSLPAVFNSRSCRIHCLFTNFSMLTRWSCLLGFTRCLLACVPPPLPERLLPYLFSWIMLVSCFPLSSPLPGYSRALLPSSPFPPLFIFLFFSLSLFLLSYFYSTPAPPAQTSPTSPLVYFCSCSSWSSSSFFLFLLLLLFYSSFFFPSTSFSSSPTLLRLPPSPCLHPPSSQRKVHSLICIRRSL